LVFLDFVNISLFSWVRLDNAIGYAGVKHFADMLKVNTTLIFLNLSSELFYLIFALTDHVVEYIE